MGWVKRLTGKTIALDTAPLIYFVEDNPDFQERVRPFFQALEQREFAVVTSTLTIVETLVKPFQLGQADRVRTFQEVLAAYVEIVPVSIEIAKLAARLRADYHLRTPDAIQVSTAIAHQADFFFTNDIRLGRLKQLEVLVLSELDGEQA